MHVLPAVPARGALVSADTVQQIERHVAQNVEFINDIEAAETWLSQAAAFEAYLRDKELQRPILGARRRIEARIGQLLGETSQGKRTDLTSGHDPKLIRDDERVDFRLLANAYTDPRANLSEDEWRKSRRALISLLRQRLGLIPPTPPLPEGKYSCIVADPPWTLDTGPDVFNGTGESGHDELAYSQMSIEQIRALQVKERAADDAHLYLWTTNRYVEQAYGIAREWGFAPSVLLVWCKTPRGIGLGDAYRLTTEFILYARKGKLKESRIHPTTWFQWPRGKHSQKPDEFYELVESMTPSHGRLEMFARRKRKGWTVWGHEA